MLEQEMQNLLAQARAIIDNPYPIRSRMKNFKKAKKVTTLPHIKIPPANFTGRVDLIEKLHEVITKNEDESDPYKRIVILNGAEGLGKKTLVQKYCQEHAHYHGQFFWINSATDSSLENSFLSLAQHFKIPQMTMNYLVNNIYHHFSTHVKNGLFIFDNVKPNLNEAGEILNLGIENYFPVEALENIPHFLVISSHFNFDKENEIQIPPIIQMTSLTDSEGTAFLRKTLKIEESNLDNLLQQTSQLFGGNPLALNLISVAISLSLKLDPLSLNNQEKHCREISIKLLETMKQFKISAPIQETTCTIWTSILKSLQEREESNSKLSFDLLSFISYMPTNRINVELLNCIESTMPYKGAEPYNPGGGVYSLQVWKCLKILQNFQIISLHKQTYCDYQGQYWISCHQLIQEWTRNYLKLQNHSYLIRLANYAEINLTLMPASYLNTLELYLKENNWPLKTYSLYLHSILYKSFKLYQLDKKSGDLVDLLRHFKKSGDKDGGSGGGIENLDFFNWFKMALVYYQQMKPHAELDGAGVKLDPNEFLDVAKSQLFEAGDEFLKIQMKLGEFFIWTLKQGEKFQDNFQIHLVAIDVLGHLWEYLLGNPQYSRHISKWIPSVFHAIQEDGLKISSETIRKFLKVVHQSEFIPLEDLLALAFKTVEIKLRQDNGQFNCWLFFWNTIKCMDDWPGGIWIETACSEMSKSSLDNGLHTCRLFVSRGGVKILTKLLTQLEEELCTGNKIHFTPDGMNLIFERVVSLLYFDEFAVSLLESPEFKLAFEISAVAAHDALLSETKPLMRCRVIGSLDRYLMIWFAIFVQDGASRQFKWKHAFKLTDMESSLLLYDKVTEYLLTLSVPSRPSRVDFLWFKWETRRVILDSFLSSYDDVSGGILRKLAYKLQQFSLILSK